MPYLISILFLYMPYALQYIAIIFAFNSQTLCQYIEENKKKIKILFGVDYFI